MAFEVIGDDDYDDVMGGDIMGYEGPMGLDGEEDDDDDDDVDDDVVVGYDDDGSPIVVGRKRRRRRRRRRKTISLSKHRKLIAVAKAKWRRSQLAPGVIAPDQGMLPLPMAGQPGNQFSAAVNVITFQGTVQKPFRGERLLASVVRTGTSATGLLLTQLFVGTDLQQLDVTQFDLEQVGDPNAFGVRLTMKPCQPGVFIRLVTTLSTALTSTDTIDCSVTLLGRNIH
jgi:hypothetical protein